jgi:hypothetical protein
VQGWPANVRFMARPKRKQPSHSLKVRAHRDAKLLRELFPGIRLYQELAVKHGIPDIFQDNGGKLLQIALLLGITVLKSREGNDAYDAEGKEYEVKTVNLQRTQQFTTHHHLNPVIIAKYRKVDWIFATYEGIELKEIYLLTRAEMEQWYTVWENKWHRDGGKDINNPKVPLSYVKEHGRLLYSGVGGKIEETV